MYPFGKVVSESGLEAAAVLPGAAGVFPDAAAVVLPDAAGVFPDAAAVVLPDAAGVFPDAAGAVFVAAGDVTVESNFDLSATHIPIVELTEFAIIED